MPLKPSVRLRLERKRLMRGVLEKTVLSWVACARPPECMTAYIHYNNLPLPPIYGWKNGYLCGTHPWPARQWTGSEENGWREIYDIDPSIVETAASVIPNAARFLRGIEK